MVIASTRKCQTENAKEFRRLIQEFFASLTLSELRAGSNLFNALSETVRETADAAGSAIGILRPSMSNEAVESTPAACRYVWNKCAVIHLAVFDTSVPLALVLP